MFIFVSAETGSAYTVVPETEEFLATPIYEDLTFDTCYDNWYEVDMEAIDREFIPHVEKIRGELRMATGFFGTGNKS